MGFTSVSNRAKSQVDILDQGAVLVPYGFVINGTSNPLKANNIGDYMAGVQVTRAAAGKFTFTINGTGVSLLAVGTPCVQCADSIDLSGQVGAATDITTGAIVVRTMTGAVMTDPATGVVVTGWLLVKTTRRRAST